MKKLFVVIFFLPLFCKAQIGFPPYTEVLKKFYSQYSFSSEDRVLGLQFARKKEGWYVQVVNQVTEIPASEQLYWSAGSKKFIPLENLADPKPPSEQEEMIDKQMFGSYSFYGYERVPYYGYAGWDLDVIKQFGHQDNRTSSDTLLDGLARAYSAYASRFLWLQFGGKIETGDSLLQTLGPLQLPSKRRSDSAFHYISKAAKVYQQLARQNPSYETIVGNAVMKVFNEQMHGFLQMQMANRDDHALTFLKQAKPTAALKAVARNFLQHLPPNSILLTYGDNDTYPLLYVQHHEGFRKDVAVINFNLLGLPAYVGYLSRKKIISFSITPQQYGDPGFNYAIHREDPSFEKKNITLAELLELLKSKKFRSENEHYGTVNPVYPLRNFQLDLKADLLKKPDNGMLIYPVWNVELGPYLTLDHILLMDIIQTNLYKRRIYFAAYPDIWGEHVAREGLFYTLPVDLKNQKLSHAAIIKNEETFLSLYLNQIFVADTLKGKVRDPGTEDLGYRILFSILDYYATYDDNQLADVVNRLTQKYKPSMPFSSSQLTLGYYVINSGQHDAGRWILEDYLAGMYARYQKQDALFGYVSKRLLQQRVNGIIEYLSDKRINSPKLLLLQRQLDSE